MRVIKEAPEAFVILSAALVIAVWLGAVKFHEQEDNTLLAQINYLHDQLSDYRNKLNGQSPDQVAKALGELNTRRTEDNARIGKLRDGLASLIGAGQEIQGKLKDPSFNVNAAEKWDQESEEFLKNNLGNSYVIRFRSAAGLLPFVTPPGLPAARGQYWEAINFRIQRLDEFSREQAVR